MINPSYKRALYYAIALHLFLVGLLITESSTKRPVLKAETRNTQAMPTQQQPEIVKAHTVDSKQVAETLEQLKQEKARQKQAEINRQKQLQQQAEAAKQERIKEQQQVQKLKEEAETIAIAKKKQIEEEKKKLKQLAEQKVKEAKRLEELKKQQEVVKKQDEERRKKFKEEEKLAELKKRQSAEKAKAEEAKAAKLRAEDAQRRQAEAQQQAAIDADNKARMQGEVNKYSALIQNAISRYWIIPENADRSMFSRFRIRLAPDGMVLEVSLLRSSGDPVFDRAAQNAIYKASPLPVPSDPAVFNIFRDFNLNVKPEHIRG